MNPTDEKRACPIEHEDMENPSISSRAPHPSSDDDMEQAEDMEDSEDAPPNKKAKVATEIDKAAKRQSRQDQRELKVLRKSQKKHSELLDELKQKWEQLRRKDQSVSARAPLLADMMQLIRGHVQEVIFKHDASRIVQSMLKYGNEQQRKEIANELTGYYVALSSTKYGRFIVLRLLKYTASVRPIIIKEIKGNVRKHIRHIASSVVIETVYTDYATSKERTHMLQELYGPEFRLFKDDAAKSLANVLTKSPLRKEHALKYIAECVSAIIEKGILGDLTIVQRILVEYLENASESDCEAMYQTLHPHLVGILHNKDGAIITMKAIQQGSTKDRKTILKTFKTFIVKLAQEEYGHWVLLQIFDTIDDTVLVNKSIISELMTSLGQLYENKSFRKTIHFLLSPRNPKHFAPALLQYLSHHKSRKSPYNRYIELLTPHSDQLIEHLLSLGNDKIITLLSHGDTALFIVDLLMRARPLTEDSRTAIFTIIIDHLTSSNVDNKSIGESNQTIIAQSDNSANNKSNIAKSQKDTSQRMIKSMIQYHTSWIKHCQHAEQQGKTYEIEDEHIAQGQYLEYTTNLFTDQLLYRLVEEGNEQNDLQEASKFNKLKELSLGKAPFIVVALCESSKHGEQFRNMVGKFQTELDADSSKGCMLLAKLLKN